MYNASFLGGASLRLDDAPVGGPAARRHPLALLAILAAHPVEEVTRDQLVSFLWPEREDRRARHLLSEALYVLRSAAGRECIRCVGGRLALDANRLRTDVRTFRDAVEGGDHRAAVEAYGGPFLDGFHLKGDGEFQHWVDVRRLHFATQHMQAMDALAAEATASGKQFEAAHWLRLRLVEDPFSGTSTRRLMTVLAQAGDRAEAIRVGREYETRLRDELSLPPAEEVTRLRARLEGPHWISPRFVPSGWSPGTSPERRAVPRVYSTTPEEDQDLRAPAAVASASFEWREHQRRRWQWMFGLGVLVALLLIVSVAAILVKLLLPS